MKYSYLITSLLFLPCCLNAQQDSPTALEGITFFETPVANDQGNAALDFPLEIPPGRQGMEPDLSISYSSAAENGWLGLGWGLEMPAFTIDTRWGVPRYNATTETESYLYKGAQLTPMARIGEPRQRIAEQEFFPRVEMGLYERIFRHGNHPNNYWWEVWGKDGAKYYYGGSPETGLMPAAVLKTPSGAVAHWALVGETDVNGNGIHYSYTKVSDPGNTGGEVGQELYIQEINYTTYKNTNGPFRIVFVRDRTLGEARRADVSIDCRLGLKRVQADLLRKVELYFQNQKFREYALTYTQGAFGKTLLEGIRMTAGDGAELFAHHFSYYDDIRDGETYVPYKASTAWNVPDDNLLGNILNPISGMTGETSAIGGAQSNNFNVGGAATVGPNDFLLFSKDKTAGGTYAYGNSSDEGVVALVDINGDGLPDKVYRKQGALHYRPNMTPAGATAGTFGAERPIHGITQFSTSSTNSNAFGAEGNPPFAFVGFEYTNSSTTNNTYFTDFNADGLIDIAQNGQVWFNHLNAEGDPVFTTNSADTPNPIGAGAALSGDLFEVDPEALEMAIDQHPLHDVVRMWQAPFSGVIQVNATVQLYKPSDPLLLSYAQDDGVRVAIQLNATEIWSADIKADDYTPVSPTGLSALVVKQGDHLYFRVQSVFNGVNDRVIWSPEIRYSVFENPAYTGVADANNLPYDRYHAEEDFVLSARQELGLPLTGSIHISGILDKNRTSDDLIITILHWRNGSSSPVFSDSLSAAETGQFPIALDLDVQHEDALSFHIHTNTQIDWKAIHWVPNVQYTASPDASVTDASGNPIFSFCPTVDLSMYNQNWNATLPQSLDSGTYILNPLLTFTNIPTLNNSRVAFSLKCADTTLIQLMKVNAISNADSLVLVLNQPQQVYIEYHFEDPAMAQLVDSAYAHLYNKTRAQRLNLVKAGYASPIDSMNTALGHLYRGWGQFEYNGNRQRATLPINEAELVLEVPEVDPDGDISTDPDQLEIPFDPVKAPFLVMVPDAKSNSYLGYDNLTTLDASTTSSSRLGADNLLPQAPTVGGEGLSAPERMTKTDEYSVAGGLGVSVLTGTASKTLTTTTVTLDVMDFNGDNYPDIIAGKRIQYTRDRGGYEVKSVTHSQLDGHHEAKSDALGFTLGGSFVPSRTSNSGEPSGEGGNKRSSKAKRRSGKLGKNAKNGGNTAGDAVGINGTFSTDGDWATHSWEDINGDGLPDKVRQNGQVALNYGYRFGPFESWGFADILRGESKDYGGGLGVSLYNGSIAGGISLTRTDNFVTKTIEDINADGLPDLVEIGETVTVRLNTGTGFTKAFTWANATQLDGGSATGESVNAAFTVCIPVFFVKICINPSTSIGRGVSRQQYQLEDINGDGFPDLLSSDNDGDLKVRASCIGRTNMLRAISQPLGLTLTMDYAPNGGSFGLPFTTWTLSQAELIAPANTPEAIHKKQSFSYENGQYDRGERAFLGFQIVETSDWDTRQNTPYRVKRDVYDNSNVYTQGIKKAEYHNTPEGQLLSSRLYYHQPCDAKTQTPLIPAQLAAPDIRVYPKLEQLTTQYADSIGVVALSGNISYTWDDYGNLLEVKDAGSGQPDEWRAVSNSYHYLADKYLMTSKDSVSIRGSGGLVRLRTTEFSPEGEAIRSIHLVSSAERAVYDFEYDEYGNTLRIVYPTNKQGQRLTYRYEYDSETHTYPIKKQDVFGNSETYTYDPRFGKPIAFKGYYGKRETHELDAFGRVIQSLFDEDAALGSDYSLKYTYTQDMHQARVYTRRYDPEFDDAFEQYDFTDALGYATQSQHLIEAIASPSEMPQVQWWVEGRRVQDDFGRVIEVHPPELTGGGGTFQSTNTSGAPYRIEYDLLDRPLRITTPNNAVFDITYDFATTPNGAIGQQVGITDPLGQEHLRLYSVQGQMLGQATDSPTGKLWTYTHYNAAGDLTEVQRGTNFITRYQYDLLGRMLAIDHPDIGLTTYTYDPAGNLLSRQTPAIREREASAVVKYFYTYDRLQRIEYPFNPQNLVIYHWGDSTALYHRNGRVYLVEDASGAREFWYNNAGQVTKELRTMIVNELQQPSFVSEYSYDTWGRLKEIGYPDGEKVSYQFNRSGKIKSFSGRKAEQQFSYLDLCAYDKYGDRVKMWYGNGTISTYEKASGSSSIASFGVQLPKAGQFFKQHYNYDALGRLTDITEAQAPDANGIRKYNQTLAYDAANRLNHATGRWESPDDIQEYGLEMVFDELSNPEQLSMLMIQSTSGQVDTNKVEQTYTYGLDQPHFPATIGDQELLPNDNGAVKSSSNPDHFQLAQYDEEDRITAFADDGYLSHFTYDSEGNLAIQSHGPGSGIALDATPLGNINYASNDFILLVSPFLEITNDSFQKHYYLEDLCIASKKGAGYFASQLLPPGQQITAGNLDLKDRLKRLRALLLQYAADQGIPPGHPTWPLYHLDISDETIIWPQLDGSAVTILPPPGWPKPQGRPDPNGPPGHPVWYEEPASAENVKAGYGYRNPLRTPEAKLFFYHQNPFGAVRLVSDKDGDWSAQEVFTPLGQVFHQERKDKQEIPFRSFHQQRVFEASGLYNSASNFYNPEIRLWMTPTETSSKDPIYNPYLLGNGNPYYADTWQQVQTWTDFQTRAIISDTEILDIQTPEAAAVNEVSVAAGSIPGSVAVAAGAAVTTPGSNKKKGNKPVDSKTGKSKSSAGGVVNNQSLLALRRQFSPFAKKAKVKDQTEEPEEKATTFQKQQYRKFTVRPGDWDGIQVPGNRHFQFKPLDTDPARARAFKRPAARKVRFKLDG